MNRNTLQSRDGLGTTQHALILLNLTDDLPRKYFRLVAVIEFSSNEFGKRPLLSYSHLTEIATLVTVWCAAEIRKQIVEMLFHLLDALLAGPKNLLYRGRTWDVAVASIERPLVFNIGRHTKPSVSRSIGFIIDYDWIVCSPSVSVTMMNAGKVPL